MPGDVHFPVMVYHKWAKRVWSLLCSLVPWTVMMLVRFHNFPEGYVDELINRSVNQSISREITISNSFNQSISHSKPINQPPQPLHQSKPINRPLPSINQPITTKPMNQSMKQSIGCLRFTTFCGVGEYSMKPT